MNLYLIGFNGGSTRNRIGRLESIESSPNRRLDLQLTVGHPPKRRKGSSSRGCCAENSVCNSGKAFLCCEASVFWLFFRAELGHCNPNWNVMAVPSFSRIW